MHSGWLPTASGIVLSLLLVRAIWARMRTSKCHGHGCRCGNDTHSKNHTTMKEYRIEGMMCNHCRNNVEKALTALPGVSAVSVDLASGTARVEGDADEAAVIAAVEAAGYSCAAVGG